MTRTYAQQRAEVYLASTIKTLNESYAVKNFAMVAVYADLATKYAKEAA